MRKINKRANIYKTNLLAENRYLESKEIANEGFSLKKGLASVALASALACAPSCKVKDSSEDTMNIQQTTYSKNQNSFMPGDEIAIELMPQNQSHIKQYKIVVSDMNNKTLQEMEGTLKDAGAYINYRIPNDYKFNMLNITLYGTNILNKEFEPIERTINITR